MWNCPKCKIAMDAQTLFENCTVSWPNQKWLWLICPGCKKEFHVHLEENKVSIGFIDGAPGPCFIPECSSELKGLKFTTTGFGIEVKLGNKKFRFRQR